MMNTVNKKPHHVGSKKINHLVDLLRSFVMRHFVHGIHHLQSRYYCVLQSVTRERKPKYENMFSIV